MCFFAVPSLVYIVRFQWGWTGCVENMSATWNSGNWIGPKLIGLKLNHNSIAGMRQTSTAALVAAIVAPAHRHTHFASRRSSCYARALVCWRFFFCLPLLSWHGQLFFLPLFASSLCLFGWIHINYCDWARSHTHRIMTLQPEWKRSAPFPVSPRPPWLRVFPFCLMHSWTTMNRNEAKCV